VTMEGMILISFMVSLLLSASTPIHPAACGCFLPFLATGAIFVLIWIWPSGSSTEGLAIPFAFMFVACGSIPGALAGAGIKMFLSH
jgi:hypothetical protein